MNKETILVINPNSTQAVTDTIAAALGPLHFESGPVIECLTLSEGPAGIESQAHVEQVVQPLCRLIGNRQDASAVVIACFSDPGLHAAREVSRKPVLGIAESGLLTALTLGERFGIVAILRSSLARHQRYVRSLGLWSRFAGEQPIGLGVTELDDEDKVLDRMKGAGRRLRDAWGADVLVLGCAGMARFREPLQDDLGVPVVEPTQAAVVLALGSARLGWSR